MTDRATKPRRLSKRALRAWAWLAGALAFFSPWAFLGLSPRPPAGEAAAQTARPVIIIRKITRRVIIHDAPKPQPIRYVTVGGGGGYSSAPVTTTAGTAPP
ncbi:MAG: hypothetical protein ACRDG9_12420 [Actinomycetota bacterium]